MKTVPIEELRASFCYTPTTGVVIHKVKKRNGVLAMQPAGSVNSKGYLMTWHKGRPLRNHRIAFALHFGRWPDGDLDHIDRNQLNNRIENLREASRSENGRNADKRTDNKSGIRGVSWHKASGKWEASIRTNRVLRYLGVFDNIDDAAMVRRIAESQIWGGIHKFEEEKYETL